MNEDWDFVHRELEVLRFRRIGLGSDDDDLATQLGKMASDWCRRNLRTSAEGTTGVFIACKLGLAVAITPREPSNVEETS